MDCSHMRSVKNPKTGKFMDVPCGVCIACRIAKTREWTLRMMMENESWKESCFITLTYDDEHLHVTPCNHVTLWPKDIQDFFKRVHSSLHRWKLKNDPDYAAQFLQHRKGEAPSPPLLKKYYCGEYGESVKTDSFKGRPHYHAVVFGMDFTHKGKWWIHHWEGKKPIYTSNELIDLWPHGLPTIDRVVPERCGYVAGYVQKKIYFDPMQYFREYGCCVFPFANQSNGIGKRYFQEHMHELPYHNWRFRIKGVGYSVPRYFIKDDVFLKGVYATISKRLQKVNLEKIDSYRSGSEYYASLQQRERELKARSKLHR